MKKITVILFFILCFAIPLLAEEEKPHEITVEPGYRFYSKDKNPALADEYSNSTSFPYIKFEAKGYTEDYKYNLLLDINEKENYDFDIHSYYKDTLRFELTGLYLDHNLGFKDNTTMFNLTPGEDYFVKFRNQRAALKYKPFLEPFHIRVNAEKMEREGDFQKRFYGNASLNPSYSSSDSIFSRKAPVNYVTNVGSVGMDGLLGGVSIFVEASKITARDEAKLSDDLLFKLPQLEENAFSLKLNSNQAGKISVALAVSRKERDNEGYDEAGRKGAKSSYNNSAFFLSYYPDSSLKLSFKASYEDYDQDNPDKWRYNGTDYLTNSYTSYVRKSAQINAKYNIATNTYLAAELKGKELDRDNITIDMPEKSSQSSAKLLFSTVLKNKCNVKVSQTYTHNNNPSYKNIAENAHKTNLVIDHTISDDMSFDVNATYLLETSDEAFTYFVENKVKTINANFYYVPTENINVGVYGLVEIQDYKSDLEFGKQSTAEHFVIRTPYEAKTFQFGINANKKLKVKQDIYGDLFYLRGYGTYTPENFSGITGSYVYDTTGLSKLAAVDFYQYGLLLGTTYKLSVKDTLKCELGYKDHNEKAESALSGSIKTVFVAWERKW